MNRGARGETWPSQERVWACCRPGTTLGQYAVRVVPFGALRAVLLCAAVRRCKPYVGDLLSTANSVWLCAAVGLARSSALVCCYLPLN